LEKYLLSDNEPHTSNTYNAGKADEHKYFFITNKACRTNYLYNELTYQADTYLILFNSRMYDVKLNDTLSLNECFYFDQFSQTFYMTVSKFLLFKSSSLSKLISSFLFMIDSLLLVCTKLAISKQFILQ
jgi:hypothetical protein